jgi:PadR family transcriptional regulator, regulatory protein PadR
MADPDLNILRESLELLILKSLSLGPRHGYAIVEWIEESTDEMLLIEEGTIYPALHRLAEKRWVVSQWGVSDSGRRARYYDLTAAGRAHLRDQAPTWQRYVEAIGRALGTTSARYAR